MKKRIVAGKRIEGILGVCLLFVFLTGCSDKVVLQEGTNLLLDKEGGVTVTYIEDFPSDYYDISELEIMNQEEVEAYNQHAGSTVVEVVSTTTDGSKLTLTMKYRDMDDYADMNQKSVYSGTVEEALALGYDLNSIFIPAKNKAGTKDEEQMNRMDWESLGTHHIVITNEPSTVHTYKKIEYTTENVEVSEDRKMATIAGEEQAVIVFK